MHIASAILLGFVQGLTEFIPVSSSGHLIIAEHWLGVEPGLTFDVALHLGTLLALVTVFRRDLWDLVTSQTRSGSSGRLGRMLALATLPAVVSGVLLESHAETIFRSLPLVAFNLMAVGVIMLLVERWARLRRGLEDISVPQAGGIGMAQALAIVPGVSRSGSTITAGLAMGLDRVAAARFSFLLAVPIIAGAILKQTILSGNWQELAAEPGLFSVGIVSAFASGYLAIRFLLSYLSRHGLAVFAYYRLALGVLIMAGSLL